MGPYIDRANRVYLSLASFRLVHNVYVKRLYSQTFSQIIVKSQIN